MLRDGGRMRIVAGGEPPDLMEERGKIWGREQEEEKRWSGCSGCNVLNLDIAPGTRELGQL